MPTIRDIAVAAGVSPSTVSKALRGGTDLNFETIALVRETAIKLGYDFNQLHSKVSNSNIIGVVCMELKSEYYGGIFNVFKQRMEEAGYRIITMMTDFDTVEKQQECIEYLLRCRVSGILYLTEAVFDIETLRSTIMETGISFVMITQMDLIDFCDTISVNHALGVQMALDHLFKMGHRRIAFVGETNTQARERAFKDTMVHLGLQAEEETVVVHESRYCQGGYKAGKRLMALPPEKRPTACFAAYDSMAYGVMRAVREAGLRVPEDFSIVGVDNNQVSEYIEPKLSSVEMPISDLGQMAADMLLERIKGDKSPYRMVYLSPRLCVRDSVVDINK